MVIICGDHFHCFVRDISLVLPTREIFLRKKQFTWSPQNDHSLTCSCYTIIISMFNRSRQHVPNMQIINNLQPGCHTHWPIYPSPTCLSYPLTSLSRSNLSSHTLAYLSFSNLFVTHIDLFILIQPICQTLWPLYPAPTSLSLTTLSSFTLFVFDFFIQVQPVCHTLQLNLLLLVSLNRFKLSLMTFPHSFKCRLYLIIWWVEWPI